jgi:hypothetical protein
MDWKFWLALIPAVVQAVFVVLDYFGVKPKSMQIEDSKRSTVKIMALLMLLTWGAVGYDLYSRPVRPGPEWDSQILTPIRDKKFAGRTVKLDGYEFINCDFDDVTFEFQGTAPSRLSGSRIKRTGSGNRMVALRSDDPVVAHTLGIVVTLNEVSGLIKGPSIQRESPSVIK